MKMKQIGSWSSLCRENNSLLTELIANGIDYQERFLGNC